MGGVERRLWSAIGKRRCVQAVTQPLFMYRATLLLLLVTRITACRAAGLGGATGHLVLWRRIHEVSRSVRRPRRRDSTLCACSVFGNCARSPWTGKMGGSVGLSDLRPGRPNTGWLGRACAVSGAHRGRACDEPGFGKRLGGYGCIGGTLCIGGGSSNTLCMCLAERYQRSPGTRAARTRFRKWTLVRQC